MKNPSLPFLLPAAAVLALVSASGCVSASKYKALQEQQTRTAQDLKDSQAHAADAEKQAAAAKQQADSLAQEKAQLTTALAAARKDMADLVSGLGTDLAQAQKGIESALKRLKQDKADAKGSSSPAGSAGWNPAATPK
ncbi:MAG: hypothetical protein KGL53_08945 [Elusimicrobia bacterium]|nr:hypothetical protein [Elusimicrobiota bacterium]